MPRILTVDDSRSIRSIVTKNLNQFGFDCDEAEDGEQGLAKLAETKFDLVVLDVTMPVLDGPGMLAKMRGRGDQTPVLMLTSESKSSIVSELIKLGIQDYILKPFKPEEFRAKVMKVLHMDDVPASMPAAEPAARAPTGRQFIDILVVDDMENVQKKLRSMVPAHVTMNSATSAHQALSLARERVFRVVLVDMEIPDVDSVALMGQLRAIQPNSAFVAMPMRTTGAGEDEARQKGFDDVLAKPFDPVNVDDFLVRFFDNQELLVTEDNVLRVGAFQGKEERLERYYKRIAELGEQSLTKVAAACFDQAILDISELPLRANRTPHLLIGMAETAKKTGIELKIVASPEGMKMLKEYKETADLDVTQADAARRVAAAG